MNRLAVLMCVRAGTSPAELQRAVESTARSMRKGDAFFVHLDGGDQLSGIEGSNMALPASWNIHFSPKKIGLAAGLNRLIEIVLARKEFELLARMDADDESLPDRLQMQRDYLSDHPEVDVLGGLCREVDQGGRFIQMKTLPADHQAILAMLPKRNPLNHPTVVFRSNVFDSGVRYREDVLLIEDYYLWIDLAVAGKRFANLEIPLLNFQRNGSFFLRRSGLGQALAEYNVRLHAIRMLTHPLIPNYSCAVAGFALRLIPSPIQSLLYRLLR